MVAITPQLRSVKSIACFSFSVAIDLALLVSHDRVALLLALGTDALCDASSHVSKNYARLSARHEAPPPLLLSRGWEYPSRARACAGGKGLHKGAGHSPRLPPSKRAEGWLPVSRARDSDAVFAWVLPETV